MNERDDVAANFERQKCIKYLDFDGIFHDVKTTPFVSAVTTTEKKPDGMIKF